MMKSMEEHKYLPPKFSDSIKNLADFIGIDYEFFEQQYPQQLKLKCHQQYYEIIKIACQYQPQKEIQQWITQTKSNKQFTQILKLFQNKQKRQDSQQTPPRMIKAKLLSSQNSTQNNSHIKTFRTPNSSSQAKRKLSSGNYQSTIQNIIINPLDKYGEGPSQILKIPEDSIIDNNSRAYSYQQSLDNSKNFITFSEKPYEGKHKELINRVQQNIQVVQSLQYSDHQKLTNSAHNPYARNYSPTPDLSNKRDKNLMSLDKTGYQKNWAQKNSNYSSNNSTFYASNAFQMYDNKTANSKNKPKQNHLYSPNLQGSFEEAVKAMKKPSTRHGSERNQSVGPSFLSKNNSNNTSIEQSQLHGSEKKQIKNIRMKKTKMNKSCQEQNLIMNTKEVDAEDNTGQTIFNSNIQSGFQKRLPSLSPQRNNEMSEDLQGFLESNFVYKEKETLQIASYDIRDQEPQKVRVKDVLLIEDQVKNEDKKKQQS